MLYWEGQSQGSKSDGKAGREGWEAESRTCIPASQRTNKKHSQWPGRCSMSPDKLYETQNNALEGGTERRSCQWLLSSFPFPFIKMKAVGVNPIFFWVGSPGLFRQQTSFGEADPLTYGGGIYGIKRGGRGEANTGLCEPCMESFPPAASPGAEGPGDR